TAAALQIRLRAVPRRTGRTDGRGRTVAVGVAAAAADGGEDVVAELDHRGRALRHRRALVVRQRGVVLTVPPCTNHISFLHGAILSSALAAFQEGDRRAMRSPAVPCTMQVKS